MMLEKNKKENACDPVDDVADTDGPPYKMQLL
jgi:hypothetical protein